MKQILVCFCSLCQNDEENSDFQEILDQIDDLRNMVELTVCDPNYLNILGFSQGYIYLLKP